MGSGFQGRPRNFLLVAGAGLGMRLADRLFAFRRLPAWTDAVQVLLWLMGWILVSLLALLLAYLGPRWISGFRSLSDETWSSALIPVIIIVLTLGWFVVGSW